MAAVALSVEGLSKRYSVGASEAGGTLYDALSGLLRAKRAKSRAEETFWALKEVGFQVHAGEVLGVIGRNGAGKSTLLKVLSRITAPTAGRVTVRGRMASLLEVGTGFHPELTGRENIFLNGAILGMKRAEIARQFDAIVAFAEIDRFVDTPVKRYSSGMYVRLAFAIAAHLDPDILLVDEVLAVGDAAFQRKSLGQMGAAARSGRTVLFVSHNLGAVRNLCTRVIQLDGGRLAFDGNANEGIARYENSFTAGALDPDARLEGPLGDDLQFHSFTCRQRGAAVNVVDPLAAFEVELRGSSRRDFESLSLKLGLYRDGIHIASCHDAPDDMPMRQGSFVSRFQFPSDVFRPGRYTIGAGVVASLGAWAWVQDLAVLEFAENLGGRSPDRTAGLIAIPFEARREQT